MPCFSCRYFKEGKGRWGENLDGGRGFCEFYDEYYWRGHECRHFAPTWYGPKTTNKEESDLSLFDIFSSEDNEEEEFFETETFEEEEFFETEDYEEESEEYEKLPTFEEYYEKQKAEKNPKRTWGIVFYVLAAIYLFASKVIEDMAIAATFSFGIWGTMMIILSKTPKESRYLFGKEKGINKVVFTWIMTIFGFLVFGITASILQ
ncbi:MAG: hypothetical protein IKZ25_00120 [Clostridia bacterium]|nr:hypothetical protein [Clostridia bacterium]